jgi:hypothetical protein
MADNEINRLAVAHLPGLFSLIRECCLVRQQFVTAQLDGSMTQGQTMMIKSNQAAPKFILWLSNGLSRSSFRSSWVGVMLSMPTQAGRRGSRLDCARA